MGGVARARRVRPRLAPTGGRRSGQSPEPEPYRHGRLRAADRQSGLGRRTGEHVIPAKTAGLPKDSVANASQIIALDRTFLTDRVGRLPPKLFAQILHGIDVVLGR